MASRFKTVSQYVSTDTAAALVGISNSDRFYPSLGFDGCIWINDTCPGKCRQRSTGVVWPKEQIKVRVSRLCIGTVRVTDYERFAVTRSVQIRYLADDDQGTKILNLPQLKRLLRKLLGTGVRISSVVVSLNGTRVRVWTEYHGMVELPYGFRSASWTKTLA